MNPFYRAMLGILCLLTVVRYAFPSVYDRPVEASRVGAYEAHLLPEVPDGQEEASMSDESVITLAEGDYPEEVDDDETEELGAMTEVVDPDAVVSDDVQAVSSRTSLLPLHSTTAFDRGKQRIISVPGTYLENFPDVQDVQYPSAHRWGIRPMSNRGEFEKNRDKLVYIGSNPYIHLDERMVSSIPYLVPRASELLEHLGKAFMDSLYSKRIPLHKFVVSSVLRTEADVRNLSIGNVNATQRSCHMFGTTFDISYNHYYTVSHPDEPERRAVRDDSLKMVLSEVLRDARVEGRCYVRYEVKQPCFHITVR